MSVIFKYLTTNKGAYARLINYTSLSLFKRLYVVPAGSSKGALTENDTSVKDVSKRIKSSINPRLTQSQLETIETFSTLELFLPYLIHSQMNKNGQIIKWEKVKIASEAVKPDLHNLHGVANYIYNTLPNSDLYVFDQKITRAKHVKMVPTMIAVASLEAMLFTKLYEKDGTSVVTMKHNSLISLFNLNVGNEQITNQRVVTSILKGDENMPRIEIDDLTVTQYLKSNPSDRELLGNIFLRAIAINILLNKS